MAIQMHDGLDVTVNEDSGTIPSTHNVTSAQFCGHNGHPGGTIASVMFEQRNTSKN
jgi:hypothetical protein